MKTVSQISLLNMLAVLLKPNSSYFMKAIINSWEMSHASKLYMQSKAAECFKNNKRKYELCEHTGIFGKANSCGITDLLPKEYL